MTCSAQLLFNRRQLLLLFITITPVNAEAEWSGSVQTGYSYTNNLGSQRTVDQGLGTSAPVSRSGWASQGNLNLQSIGPDGGQSLDLSGLFDKSSNKTADIKDMTISASLFRALNPRWLWRFSGFSEHYQDDAVRASSYSGHGAMLTFGYFGHDKQGLDSTLAWKYEDHSEDPTVLYTTHRTWLNLVYYLPRTNDASAWSIQTQIRHNSANNSFPDYNSYLFGVTFSDWTLGRSQASVGLQWRGNYYENNSATGVSPNSQSTQIYNGLGMGMPGTGTGNNGSLDTLQDLNDQLFSVLFKLTIPISRYWSAQLDADTGRYKISTIADTQNYYRIFTGVQRNF